MPPTQKEFFALDLVLTTEDLHNGIHIGLEPSLGCIQLSTFLGDQVAIFSRFCTEESCPVASFERK